jgi:hypothetical protein
MVEVMLLLGSAPNHAYYPSDPNLFNQLWLPDLTEVMMNELLQF